MIALSVVGAGMVSPLGLTPAEHAFFVRAGTGPAAPGAFVDDQGETLNVAHCPWLGAGLPVAERLAALGERALAGALGALPPGGAVALFACTAAPRAGLVEADRQACEAALCRAAKAQAATRATGEAGFFHAIGEAAALLGQGAARFAAVVAADSFVAPAILADWQRRATTPWEANLPRPAEGAAALVLALPSEARQARLDVLATLHESACLPCEATDDDDAIVDGAALTALLRGASRGGAGVAAVFGQHRLGSLRSRAWAIASARTAEAFRPDCVLVSIEHEIGCLGAAAGAMNLAHGIAIHRHRAWPIEDGAPDPREDALRDGGPFLAWAISPDGTHGLCAASAHA